MKNIGIELAPSHAYGRAFAEGVAEYAAGRDQWRLKPLTQTTLNPSNINNYDGIILRLFGNRVENLARNAGVPVVDIYCERERNFAAQIHSDYDACGRIAAEFFLSRGFRNFGWCGIGGIIFSDTNQNAFRSALSAKGLKVDCYNCPGELNEKITSTTPDRMPDARAIKKWLRQLKLPAAVLCCNDHRAYQVMQCALEIDLRIPEDIALLGCDNDTLLCSFAPIPLSSIDPDARRHGHDAARLLDAIMRERAKERPHKMVLVPPKTLIKRASTETIPQDLPWLATLLLFIERNLASRISASDVFKQAGYSSTYVERIFRRELGCSIHQYLENERLRKAISLIKSGNLMIKQIAAECGFSSPQYFCRVFKTRYGHSPGAVS